MTAKAQHWLKTVPQKGRTIAQSGLFQTQVHVDRSSVRGLQLKYQELRETGCLNLESFLIDFLNWEFTDIQPTPDRFSRHLPQQFRQEIFERRHRAVRDPDTKSWVLAIQIISSGEDLDSQGNNLPSPTQDFVWYLRQIKVPIGILFNRDRLRLIYVDTKPNWIDFDMGWMATPAGAPALAGLESILNATRMFSVPTDRRLKDIISNSQPKSR
jgi:hypothetical protein